MDPFAAALTDLLPEEASGLQSARPERVLEFRAGRHCARAALVALGAPRDAAIVRAPDRSPIWPAGFVGSITHTRRGKAAFCAAAVARACEARAIGLDAEADEPLGEELWERVLIPRERLYVESQPPGERGVLAKLVFSAKECVYKCQHPLSKRFLEFGDVEIELDRARGTFTGRIDRDAAPLPAGTVLPGRFVRRGGVIVTAITLWAGSK